MRLRKQLLFLSLITLALPWVGCQYVKEMDSALRKGQTDALMATARAVSARLSSDAALKERLINYTQLRQPLYAHTLQSPLILDGYDNDWRNQGYAYTPFANANNAELIIGTWKNAAYVVVQIKKTNIRYFNPAELSLDHCDRIILAVGAHRYAVYASTPGRIIVSRLNNELIPVGTEHRIQGFLLEGEHGYQVELRLPLDWLESGFAISAFEETSVAALDDTLPLPQEVVSLSTHLTQEISVFVQPNTRLHLTTDKGQIIASAGNLNTVVANERHGFVEWLYSIILSNREFLPLKTVFETGEFDVDEVHQALFSGAESANWLQHGRQIVARTALPIYAGTPRIPIAAVVAEQSAAPLTDMTNSAINRLLAYSFVASTFAGLCLIIYATWLSLRIRKLSEAAANAINESGKIAEHFPISRNRDEIGDLSRSYALLLSRLREYTHYLRTLSSKLSHELRTPLAIVRSSLDNLEHETLNDQAKVYAERAREGTTRLSNILNAMSAASRVEQAIGASEREVIPCDELLSNLKDAYVDVYQDINFQLNIRHSPKGLQLYGSGELLVQALDKLVDNAADFCTAGGLIELGLYRHQNFVVFTVRNEGPPLPSHMQDQLFNSMVSVRDQASNSEDGHHLGLGLYIVRLITDFHQGEVHGYNVPDGSGVIFEVRLPAYEGNN